MATFDQVPVSRCSDRARFADVLVRQAAQRTIKVLWMGDSLSVQGERLYQALLRAADAHYGNTPGFSLVDGANISGGWPAARSLFQTHGSITTTDRVAESYMFPGMLMRTIRGSLGANDGILINLDHVGSNMTDTRFITGKYFTNTPDSWVMDIYCATNASSGEIHWKSTPASSKSMSWATATNSGTTAMGLESGTFAVKKATTDALQLDVAGGNSWIQTRMYGSDAVKYTDFLGASPRNITNPQGLLIQPYAGGGATLTSLLGAQFANIGSMVTTFDPDIIVVATGINEGTADMSAVNYGLQFDGASGLVAKARAWKADVPIIVFSEPFAKRPNTTGTAMPTQAEVDKYPGEVDARVDQYSAFWHINGRLMADNRGYDSTGLANYTITSGTDVGTHPNNDGAWLLADLFFSAIRKELATSGPTVNRRVGTVSARGLSRALRSMRR